MILRIIEKKCSKKVNQNNPFFHKKTLIHRIEELMARNMCIFVMFERLLAICY